MEHRRIWRIYLDIWAPCVQCSLQQQYPDVLTEKVSAFNYSESKVKGDKHREALPKDKIA